MGLVIQEQSSLIESHFPLQKTVLVTKWTQNFLHPYKKTVALTTAVSLQWLATTALAPFLSGRYVCRKK